MENNRPLKNVYQKPRITYLFCNQEINITVKNNETKIGMF